MSDPVTSGAWAGPVGIGAVPVKPATGPLRLEVGGTPGPTGPAGPEGPQGSAGEPGITLLPTDTPINGGFF